MSLEVCNSSSKWHFEDVKPCRTRCVTLDDLCGENISLLSTLSRAIPAHEFRFVVQNSIFTLAQQSNHHHRPYSCSLAVYKVAVVSNHGLHTAKLSSCDIFQVKLLWNASNTPEAGLRQHWTSTRPPRFVLIREH